MQRYEIKGGLGVVDHTEKFHTRGRADKRGWAGFHVSHGHSLICCVTFVINDMFEKGHQRGSFTLCGHSFGAHSFMRWRTHDHSPIILSF